MLACPIGKNCGLAGSTGTIGSIAATGAIGSTGTIGSIAATDAIGTIDAFIGTTGISDGFGNSDTATDATTGGGGTSNGATTAAIALFCIALSRSCCFCVLYNIALVFI